MEAPRGLPDLVGALAADIRTEGLRRTLHSPVREKLMQKAHCPGPIDPGAAAK